GDVAGAVHRDRRRTVGAASAKVRTGQDVAGRIKPDKEAILSPSEVLLERAGRYRKIRRGGLPGDESVARRIDSDGSGGVHAVTGESDVVWDRRAVRA